VDEKWSSGTVPYDGMVLLLVPPTASAREIHGWSWFMLPFSPVIITFFTLPAFMVHSP
jgi:hypothetical protein